MRVVILAAGAGGMYCGSCLRDNRLAKTLIDQKRDVSLISLYTPIRTDETDVSQHDVYFGGVSVFLEQKSKLMQRAPGWLLRMLDSNAILRLAGKFAGRTRGEDLGPMTVSVLQGSHGAQRREVERLVDALAHIKPDVVNLPNLMFVGVAEEIRRATGAAVVCTLSGEDIFLDVIPSPHREEAIALIEKNAGAVDAFIGVTDYFTRFAADTYCLPHDRCRAARMGIDVDAFAGEPARRADRFRIAYLARICRQKGLHNLVPPLAHLRERGLDTEVVAAGYLGHADKKYLTKLLADAKTAGLADRFHYRGEVSFENKVSLLQSAHVFCVPAEYHESKGLYILEAMAAGVPVVAPAHGAFPELIEATGGGLLYDPTKPGELADRFAELAEDENRRCQLAHSGRQVVRESFNDEQMAGTTWAIYEEAARRRASTSEKEAKKEQPSPPVSA